MSHNAALTQQIREALEILEIGVLDANEPLTQDSLNHIIKRKYHEKALDVHPDRKGSDGEFQKVLSAYHLLCQVLENDQPLLKNIIKNLQASQQAKPFLYHSGNFQLDENKVNPAKSRKKQKDFELYKNTVRLYSDTLDHYFEKVEKVNLDPNDPEYQKLCEQLQKIKTDFFEVIKLNPGGMWTKDCIEKISRINVWLKKSEGVPPVSP